MQPVEVLEKYWGHKAFREKQADIVNAVLAGHDTLAILPTGGGKSVCYQVPALMQEGICLVVSPLIALIKDQVQSLTKKGVPALALYSGMDFIQVKKTLQNATYGNYKFLYVSPERLESTVFLDHIQSLPISLIAVDEAHCISQWGYDFRPTYLRIASLRNYFPNVPLLAVTASATSMVQDDIMAKLEFRTGSKSFTRSLERKELSYSVFETTNKQMKLVEIFKNVPGSGIVYCKTRRRTTEVAALLAMKGIKASYYHAGMQQAARAEAQDKWMQGHLQVIACTNAFGMGIDKSNVRAVVHYDMPDSLEYYYQEAGRAGRDEKRAYGVILYDALDIAALSEQPNLRYPTKEVIQHVFKALVNYLQVPSESGEGVYFDFDMSEFVKAFKLGHLQALYALKALEQEEIITYNENVFLPATLVFITDKNTIVQFQRDFPQFEDVIKGLLRSYQGIFDFPANIHEPTLAKFVSKPIETVRSLLRELHQRRIVDYQPIKDKGQILFLRNRVRTKDLQINERAHEARKQAFEKRIQAIINYARDRTTCRSVLISNYFNDAQVASCGICDNCINNKQDKITRHEFDEITTFILTQTTGPGINLPQLLHLMKHFPLLKVKEVLSYLQTENKVAVTHEGKLVSDKRSFK